MATKKAASKSAPEVLTISAEQFLAGMKRFSTVCDFVEREMRKVPTDNPAALSGVRYDDSNEAESSAPKASPSVEEMALEMRSIAQDVAKQAETIRERMTTGGVTIDNAAGSALCATRGPIKDYVDLTTHFLFSIRRDLETINQYING
jgi:hypothetical protein